MMNGASSLRGRAVLLVGRLCNDLGFCIGCAAGVFRSEMQLKRADGFPGVFIQDAAERDPVITLTPECDLESQYTGRRIRCPSDQIMLNPQRFRLCA
ncbi:hypothetical protein SZ66_21870 [Pantoea ananatis]|nr:hypothetical protein [Pantoea ananatis]